MRYWVGMGTAGKDIVDRSTNASCSQELIGNLTLLSPAIDSLGMEMWKLSSSGGKPTFTLTTTGASPDPGLLFPPPELAVRSLKFQPAKRNSTAIRNRIKFR